MINGYDLTGQKFNRLFVIECAGRTKKKSVLWLCKCDCGKEKIICTHHLTKSIVKSCGCWNRIFKCSTWKGHEEISGSFFKKIKISAEKRSIKFSITIEQIWNLFLSQSRKCAISNIDIYFPLSNNHLGTASLDRIDSSQDYTIDNVQWVHKNINLLKHIHSNKKFIELCKIITVYNEKKSNKQ
jgi:hypothetical protein